MSIEIGNMVLFHCPKDPRTMSSPIGPIPLPPGPPLARTLRSSVKEGHYMMYLYGTISLIHPRASMLEFLSQTSSNMSLFGHNLFPLNSSGEVVLHRRRARLLQALHHLV